MPCWVWCVGTLLFWLGRGTAFGHATIESVLKINPMAAALTIVEAPGSPPIIWCPTTGGGWDSWWLPCGVIVLVQTWRLTRPL